MLPVCTDFTKPLQLPQAQRPARRHLVFFPGSTLGNFTDDAAVELLDAMRQTMGSDGCALIGIDLDGFRHHAVYARERGRIETFLISQCAQRVQVGGKAFEFAEGEAMQVEYSYKYTDARFAELAAAAGLKVTHGWNDAKDWFGLRVLRPL
jgi:uncharacterized SAM-dependent methyltransferase